MAKNEKKKKSDFNLIVKNKKASFNYFIEKELEAGISLYGWEVKSLRKCKVQISEAHIIFRKSEAFIIGSVINPLQTACSHYEILPNRTRKLLLNKKEIYQLATSIERQNYTCVPLALYWNNGKVKCKIALAKGKKNYDKRKAIKDRDWNREKLKLLKYNH